MTVQSLTLEMSRLLAVPESEVIHKGRLALIEKEMRLAEMEIAAIRERYDLFSKEALYDAIRNGSIPGHPAWEDYIVWKNQEAHITQLRKIVRK